MKKPSQFWPMLRQMLGFYRYGPLPLLIYLAISGAVFLVSASFLPIDWMQGHARDKFWSDGLFVSCCASWLFLMLVSTALPFIVLGGITSTEFLFTRAIDRGLWLRAERVAVMIISLGPLILNLALSPLCPELAFDPAPPGPESAVQARYTRIFNGSHLSNTDSGRQSPQLIIRHGNEALAAWMVWAGAVCVFLVAGYFAWAFAAWQRAGWHHSESKKRPWLGAIMVNAPAYSPIVALLVCAVLRINPLEESFLLFASHPVLMTLALIALILVVQPWSERNIRKLEFEFL